MSVLAGLPRTIISFAMGSPAADAIPRATIGEIAAETLRSERGTDALDYAPTEGHPALRTALLAWLGQRSLAIEPESLLITTGGMQGLDLVCRLFLDEGDLVLAESPSYANGLATLHNNGARIVQVPLDQDGMDLDEAMAAVAREGPPKLIYTIPTFQNPSAITYSLARRRALLAFAHATGALILEDDPYRDLSYEGDVPESLLELDAGRGSVIGVNTFSKIVAPGLRVGWVVAPADAVERMVAARQSMDTCANALAQRIVARLIETGGLDEHIRRLRALYPRRRDAMMSALTTHLGHHEGIHWTRPTGGMFLWLELPDGIDGGDVLEIGLEHGVAIVPGRAFDPVRCRTAVRLCYAAQDEPSIALGVARLARAVNQLSGTYTAGDA